MSKLYLPNADKNSGREPEILSGKLCPYCFRITFSGWSKDIYDMTGNGLYAPYGKLSGRAFKLCKGCSSYVGCHSDTGVPYGDVANHYDRVLRRKAHGFFDTLWKVKVELTGIRRSEARSKAYLWLSNEMELPIENTHIAMFYGPTTIQCIEICAEKVYSLIK